MRTTTRLLRGVLVLTLAVSAPDLSAPAEPPRSPSPLAATTPAKQAPPQVDRKVSTDSRDTAAPVGPPGDARAALAAGDAQRALSLLESQTLQLSPAERFSVAGQAHFLLGDYAEARRKLEAALRQRPNLASDLYWLGRVHASAGMPALATARFEDAAWNGLETADLHYHWALALKASNEILGKISQHPPEEGAKETPKPGIFALGGLVVGPLPARPGWVVVSPPSSAIYHAHRAVALAPQRGDALLLCGQLWTAANRHEQAAAAFAKAAPLLQKDELATCHEGWSASLRSLGDLDGYLEQVKQGLAVKGDVDSAELARSFDVAAREAAQHGDVKRQIRYLTQAVELEPTGVDRLIALADALLQVQRVDDAARYLRTALQQGPSRKQKKEIGERLQRATYLTAPR